MSYLWEPRAGNVLSYGQATFEDGGVGYYWVSPGLTAANSSAQACSGTKSLAVTYANSTANTVIELASSTTARPPVVAGQVYTASFALRSDQTSGETFQPVIYWYTTTGVGPAINGTTTTVTNAGWTTVMVTGVMPATAVTATVAVRRVTGAAGAVLYIDQAGLWMGAGGVWAPPGVPISGLGMKTDNTAGKASYIWDETVPGWRLIAYDTGMRDVSSLLANGWTLSSSQPAFSVRRTLTTVHLLVGLNPTSKTDVVPGVLPSGFLPIGNNFQVRFGESSSGSSLPGYIAAGGSVVVIGATTTDVFGTVSWTAAAALPTSLPGTQVTAPV